MRRRGPPGSYALPFRFANGDLSIDEMREEADFEDFPDTELVEDPLDVCDLHSWSESLASSFDAVAVDAEETCDVSERRDMDLLSKFASAAGSLRWRGGELTSGSAGISLLFFAHRVPIDSHTTPHTDSFPRFSGPRP